MDACDSSLLRFKRYKRNLKKLRAHQILPRMTELPKSHLAKIIVQLQAAKKHPELLKCPFKCSFCTHIDTLAIRVALREVKESFQCKEDGVCLDCVKSRGESLRKGTCRVKHSDS